MDLQAMLKSSRELLASDDEEEEIAHDLLFVRPQNTVRKRAPGGSVHGRAPNKRRNYHARHVRLLEQYFSPFAVYDERDFRRRFRMQRSLFIKLCEKVALRNPYFDQRQAAVGKVGISTLLKCTAAIRVLAYASSADSIDENLEMSESTINKCVRHFCEAIIAVFGEQYIPPPSSEEIVSLLQENARRGFIGMVGSIDCMHWVWKNCPMALAGQHKGKENKPTKVLEAVADYSLRIWHYNFGSPGSLNDLNILDQSPVFDAILRGDADLFHFEVNGHQYDTPYFLADGIYPEWPLLVKSIENPLGKKRQHYVKCQEACRKDVERCFGVLKARWHILESPCRLWSPKAMEKVMMACVILHNMIIEDEIALDVQDDQSYSYGYRGKYDDMPKFNVSRPPPFTGMSAIDSMIFASSRLQDPTRHRQLQADLVEHLWAQLGNHE